MRGTHAAKLVFIRWTTLKKKNRKRERENEGVKKRKKGNRVIEVGEEEERQAIF